MQLCPRRQQAQPKRTCARQLTGSCRGPSVFCACPRHQKPDPSVLCPPNPDIDCCLPQPVSSHHDASQGPLGAEGPTEVARHEEDLWRLPGCQAPSEIKGNTFALQLTKAEGEEPQLSSGARPSEPGPSPRAPVTLLSSEACPCPGFVRKPPLQGSADARGARELHVTVCTTLGVPEPANPRSSRCGQPQPGSCHTCPSCQAPCWPPAYLDGLSLSVRPH